MTLQLGWFKCLQKYYLYVGKNTHYSHCNSDFWSNICSTNASISKFIWNYSKHNKSSRNIVSDFNVSIGSFVFFIQRHLIIGDERKKKRQRHFERVNTEVFKPWLQHRFSEDEPKFLLKRTFQDLQLNITSILDASEKHNLAESHLESYNHATEYIRRIRMKEKEFDTKVSEFVSEIEPSIVQSVQVVNPSFHEYSAASNDTLCYARSNIGDYLFKCAQNIPLNLIVQSNSESHLSQLQIDQGRNFVAIADPQTLLNVKTVLEQLRNNTVKRVKELVQERNIVTRIYDEQLILIVNDIASAINEEEPIDGGCGLSYCPKSQINNAQPNNPQ